jgi:hypothetical protein
MMILAHVVWGVTLGALAGIMSSKKSYISLK